MTDLCNKALWGDILGYHEGRCVLPREHRGRHSDEDGYKYLMPLSVANVFIALGAVAWVALLVLVMWFRFQS